MDPVCDGFFVEYYRLSTRDLASMETRAADKSFYLDYMAVGVHHELAVCYLDICGPSCGD